MAVFIIYELDHFIPIIIIFNNIILMSLFLFKCHSEALYIVTTIESENLLNLCEAMQLCHNVGGGVVSVS